jgi:hypothetical protein
VGLDVRLIVGSDFALRPASVEDLEAIRRLPQRFPVAAEITRPGPKKLRSYRQLCKYFVMCGLVAENASDNSNMNTKAKVDHLTRIRCDFVEDVIWHQDKGTLLWIPKRLNYASCDQDDANRFMNDALPHLADAIGTDPSALDREAERRVGW